MAKRNWLRAQLAEMYSAFADAPRCNECYLANEMPPAAPPTAVVCVFNESFACQGVVMAVPSRLVENKLIRCTIACEDAEVLKDVMTVKYCSCKHSR